MIRRVAVCAALALIGCKSEGETTDETIEATGSTKPTGSAGGFSASLSADLSRGSEGSAAGSNASGSAAGSGSATAGSAAGSGSAGSGSTGSAAGSAKPMTGSAAGSGSASMPSTGSAAGSGSAKPVVVAAGSGAGSAKATPPAAGSGAGSAKATPPAAGSGAKPMTGSAAPVAVAPVPKGPIKVSAELAAIKLSLLPNWDRDVEAAGTISLAVRVQSRDESAVFTFNYGYDDARAPADREAYKKFLSDSKILTVIADRQRGAAWYLEGTDAAGKPAFRFLVNYGGKRLVCYGSLYKDSGFGDIRDEVIIQAKKICETIQL